VNTGEIVALKDELVDRDAPRHAKYDMIMDAVGGDYQNRRMDGFWESWQEITGRPIPSDREAYEFKLNLLPSLISAKRSFIGTIPSLQVPTAGPVEPGDKKLRPLAEKLERVYQGFWTYSHIGKRMNQIGYWNPTLGTTVGVVWPDVENKRPSLQMRSPYGCYPILRDVDGQDIASVVFNTKYKVRQARAMFPTIAAQLDGEGDVDVTQYMDDERIVTIVDDEYRIKDIENKWGFVPVVMIPNEAFGEGPWGDSDIEWSIPVQEEHNYRESLKSAILEQTIMQPLAIEGGDNLPEEIPMGPRDAIPVQLGGRVYRVNPIQVPYQYLQSQSDLIKLLDRVGQIPEVMRSQFEGSVLTGRGVSTLMGPTQMAFNVKGNEIYPSIATLNKMAMKMWHAMWSRYKHTVYALGSGNSMIVESFKTAEFEGWYENIVYVDASSYFDAQSRFVMVLQAVQNRLMSRQTAMQFVPGVNDAPAESSLIKSEFEEDMQLQQAAASFNQANVQPDMAAQGALNANLTKGYAGETPEPQPIGGIEAPPLEGTVEQQTAEDQGAEEGTLLQDLIEFFGEIKLHGKVWLAGGIVMDPTYSPDSPGYNGIEVYLADPNDKAAINEVMRRPEYAQTGIHGNFRYHTGEPNPNEPSILVFDPNADQEPEEDEMMQALQGGPGGSQEAVQAPQGPGPQAGPQVGPPAAGLFA
jgi:hypothetical protein